MSDTAKKKFGKPFSTSRAQEKANKKRTHKIRRAEGKRIILNAKDS